MKRSRKWRSAQLNKRRARLKGGALLRSLGVPSWLQNYFDPVLIGRIVATLPEWEVRGAPFDHAEMYRK